MSSVDVLRRNGVTETARVDQAQDKRTARRNAFETNLALQLEKTLGGAASLSDIESITKALGAEYQKMTHVVDARTSVRLGGRRYFVFQLGWAPMTGDSRLDALDPFASKLMTRLPMEVVDQLETRIKAVGAALGRTEISRRHPTDWRLRLNTPWVRLYLNFLSGKDKRRQAVRVTHNRRKPVNEDFGLSFLLLIAVSLSLLGVGLICGTLWALVDLMANHAGRESLLTLFEGSMDTLTSYISVLRSLI